MAGRHGKDCEPQNRAIPLRIASFFTRRQPIGPNRESRSQLRSLDLRLAAGQQDAVDSRSRRGWISGVEPRRTVPGFPSGWRYVLDPLRRRGQPTAIDSEQEFATPKFL